MAVAPAVTNKIAVDRLAEAGFLAPGFAIAKADDGVTSQAAVDTNGGAALVIPAPAENPRRLICINARGANIREVSGKRAFQDAVFKAAEIRAVGAAHNPQIQIAGVFLVVPRAPVAVDTTIHLMLHQGAQILIGIGALVAI